MKHKLVSLIFTFTAHAMQTGTTDKNGMESSGKQWTKQTNQ